MDERTLSQISKEEDKEKKEEKKAQQAQKKVETKQSTWDAFFFNKSGGDKSGKEEL